MDQEAPDKFTGLQCHAAVALVALLAVIFPLERHTVFVGTDQSAVGNSDTMGITGQVTDH